MLHFYDMLTGLNCWFKLEKFCATHGMAIKFYSPRFLCSQKSILNRYRIEVDEAYDTISLASSIHKCLHFSIDLIFMWSFLDFGPCIFDQINVNTANLLYPSWETEDYHFICLKYDLGIAANWNQSEIVPPTFSMHFTHGSEMTTVHFELQDSSK